MVLSRITRTVSIGLEALEIEAGAKRRLADEYDAGMAAYGTSMNLNGNLMRFNSGWPLMADGCVEANFTFPIGQPIYPTEDATEDRKDARQRLALGNFRLCPELVRRY